MGRGYQVGGRVAVVVMLGCGHGQRRVEARGKRRRKTYRAVGADELP